MCDVIVMNEKTINEKNIYIIYASLFINLWIPYSMQLCVLWLFLVLRVPGSLLSMDSKAIVRNTGAVIFLPYITFSTFCSFDFTAFPYDKQTCQIIYGSETYSKDQMNIGHSGKKFHQTDELDIEDHSSVDSGNPYYEHNQWTVVSTKGSIKAKHYKCCPGEIWETLIIRVTAQRNANYYRYVFVTSAVVFAIMGPLVFALPVDSPQKINLGKKLRVTSPGTRV